jgi:hypothetical protein
LTPNANLEIYPAVSVPVTDVASAAQIAIPAVQLAIALGLFANAVVPLIAKRLQRARQGATAQPVASHPPGHRMDLFLVDLNFVVIAAIVVLTLIVPPDQITVGFFGLSTLILLVKFLRKSGPAQRWETAELMLMMVVTAGFQIMVWLLDSIGGVKNVLWLITYALKRG